MKIEENLDSVIDRAAVMDKNQFNKLCDSLSKEEKQLLLSLLKNKNCYTCKNEKCNIQTEGLVALDENGNIYGDACLGWENNVALVKCKLLSINDASEAM